MTYQLPTDYYIMAIDQPTKKRRYTHDEIYEPCVPLEKPSVTENDSLVLALRELKNLIEKQSFMIQALHKELYDLQIHIIQGAPLTDKQQMLLDPPYVHY